MALECRRQYPSLPDLRGLVESGALLPWCHAARQGEENAPVADDQLRHEGHFDEHGGTGRQVAHADGEHILRGNSDAEVKVSSEEKTDLMQSSSLGSATNPAGLPVKTTTIKTVVVRTNVRGRPGP